MEIADIMRSTDGDLALMIGNGIHQYGGNGHNSWSQLLAELSKENGLAFNSVPVGASATEFFDVLDLKSGGGTGELGARFCDLMADWRGEAHHRRIMGWAVRREAPVLTTNFDEVLSQAVDASLMRPRVKGFTDFYPWDS